MQAKYLYFVPRFYGLSNSLSFISVLLAIFGFGNIRIFNVARLLIVMLLFYQTKHLLCRSSLKIMFFLVVAKVMRSCNNFLSFSGGLFSGGEIGVQKWWPNNACTRTAGITPSKSVGSGFEQFRFSNESSPSRRP